MPSELAQEFQIGIFGQPGVVIDDNGLVHVQQRMEGLQNAFLVRRDVLRGENRALAVLAGRIADLRRPAAQQDDGGVAGLLQAAQHHDLNQAADVKAGSGRVETDIAGHGLAGGQRVQALDISRLIEIAASGQGLYEIGFVLHRPRLLSRRGREGRA